MVLLSRVTGNNIMLKKGMDPKIACFWQRYEIPEGQNLYTISKIQKLQVFGNVIKFQKVKTFIQYRKSITIQ